LQATPLPPPPGGRAQRNAIGSGRLFAASRMRFPAPGPIATERSMAQQQMARDETVSCIAADRVQGTSVYNRAGDKLGTVDKVMIDKVSGRVCYAVMSFGGFLGIGERYHPLPWDVLDYDLRMGGYVIDLTREQLEGAPTIGRNERVDYDDPVWGRKVHEYYGVTPWWPQPLQ